jgi:hypothetical protein
MNEWMTSSYIGVCFCLSVWWQLVISTTCQFYPCCIFFCWPKRKKAESNKKKRRQKNNMNELGSLIPTPFPQLFLQILILILGWLYVMCSKRQDKVMDDPHWHPLPESKSMRRVQLDRLQVISLRRRPRSRVSYQSGNRVRRGQG